MGQMNMTEIERRKDNVARLLLVFKQWADSAGEEETDVTDLLADMMHFCDDYGFDFSYCLQNAEQHYREEKQEEAGDNLDADAVVSYETEAEHLAAVRANNPDMFVFEGLTSRDLAPGEHYEMTDVVSLADGSGIVAHEPYEGKDVLLYCSLNADGSIDCDMDGSSPNWCEVTAPTEQAFLDEVNHIFGTDYRMNQFAGR